MAFIPLPGEYDKIGAAIVEASFKVHRRLGAGLLEKYYETCLCYELQKAGLTVARQVCVPLKYDEIIFDEGLRIDLLVEEKIIVEIKSVESMIPLWHAQVLTQLKITGYRLGYLINFNVPLLKDGINLIIL
jgi:GxxExxY protein